MKVYNIPIEMNAAMNTDITSQALQLYNMFGYSIQLEVTGTPTGTFKLQASSDPVPQGPQASIPQPTNWTDIQGSLQDIIAAGDIMWNVFDVMYTWVRVVYTDTSGGTSDAVITLARFNGKGF